MIRRPPRSTLSSSSAASDVYKRQVLEPDVLFANTTAQDSVSCNGLTDGSASVTAIGGNLNYIYQWDVNAGSQTTDTATNLGAGTYTVTAVSYTHLRAHETGRNLVCRLLLEKKKKNKENQKNKNKTTKKQKRKATTINKTRE